jgi:hypothetical protein
LIFLSFFDIIIIDKNERNDVMRDGFPIRGSFDRFCAEWNKETFLEGAFGGPMDFDEYLDDPETGVGDPTFDHFSKEIGDYMLPTDIGLEVYKL